MSKFEDKQFVINIHFPTKKYQQYLAKYGVKDLADLKSYSEAKEFFLTIITDFRRGWLSVDELGEIATMLNSALLQHDAKGSELENLTYECSELPYYVRQATTEPLGQFSVFSKYMMDIMAFYKKNYSTKESLSLHDLNNNISQSVGPMEIKTDKLKEINSTLYNKTENNKK